MLSIGAASGGYYASLSHEDYYHDGGEPPGLWHGHGADHFGLSGQVDKDIFLNLCEGFSPRGEPLTQNAGKENHRAGFDLTFSAPKSVSVLWSQADPEVRRELQAAQFEAIKKALDYLERDAAFTRRGKGGTDLERCGLVVATFEHGTSRAQDPQLHTHAVVLNVTTRDDGTTGTIESKPLFRHKMAAGAVYRAELAHQLEKRLSVEIVAGKKETFELKGVPEKLVSEFSKRHEQIEAAMKAEGARVAERAAYFTLTTREKKAHVARDILFDKWQEVGREHSFSPETVINRSFPHLYSKGTSGKEAVAERAAGKITESQAYFTEKELVRRAAEAAQTRGMNADDVLSAVGKYLSQDAVHLGRMYGERYYTTREIDALEKRMLSQVMASRFITHEPRYTDAMAVSPQLNEEQKKALFHVTGAQGSIHVVSGMAGTGKTTLLNSAREVWEAQGFTVTGAALAAVAAKGLEEGAGIKSATIARTLLDLERGKAQVTDRTILVLDEAGMIGTRQMARLIDEVTKAGAKLVLVGDEKQLQPIEHGAPFKAIGERLGRSELTDIKRQRDEWARDAVKNFALGRAESGLQSYAERGLLTVTESRKEAMRELIRDWAKSDESSYQERLIIAGTKAEVRALNRFAQAERQVKGELGTRSVEINAQRVFERDRVLFTKNSRAHGVNNGDLGKVERIDEKTRHVVVKLDGGKRVIIPTGSYEHVELGYAITAHKGQGKTVERAFVLTGGTMQDRELTYVQMSRTRGETRIYTERAEAGDTIAELSKTMNRTRQKELAHDILGIIDQRESREAERMTMQR